MGIKVNKVMLMIVAIVSLGISVFGQTKVNTDSLTLRNQQMLKDYFLCSCITKGFKDDSLAYKDYSMQLYTELLRYSFADLQKIKQFSISVIEEINQATGEKSFGVGDRRGVLGTCIEYARGKELDEMVKSMKIEK